MRTSIMDYGLDYVGRASVYRTSVIARGKIRVIELGPGIYDCGTWPVEHVGETVIVNGAGREATIIVGRGENHSTKACAFNCVAKRVEFADLTLQSAVPGGAQSMVVGFGGKRSDPGSTCVLRHVNVLGAMFGTYSWAVPRQRFLISDSTISAGCFPICCGYSGAGPDGQHVEMHRVIVKGDASRRVSPTAVLPNATGDDETYSTVNGAYMRGGTLTGYDCIFDLVGDEFRHGCRCVGIPSNAATGTKVRLYNPIFRIEANGALRTADVEDQGQESDIVIRGGIGHEGGKPKIVRPKTKHIEQ